MVAARTDRIFEDIVETIREPLLVLDSNLKVILASRSFINSFKVTREETLGNFIFDLGDKQWDIPKLRELLETILPEKTSFDNYEVEHDFATIGRRTMLLNARQIKQSISKDWIILLAIEDITERKKIEAGREKTRKELVVIKQAADEAHEFAESIINTVREPLISLNQDLRVVSVSRSFYEFFQVKPEATVGQLIYDLGNRQWDIPKLRELLETILPEQTAFDNYEVEHDFADIGRRTMLLNARQIERGTGRERIILLAIEDITDRKQAEDNIKASLAEKETLLNEVHHRVKNNMQVISSLLNLQAGKVKDKDFASMLKDSQNRIQSMALVYNKLYQSQDLAQINMADYIRELTVGIIRSYTEESQRITPRVEPGGVLLGLDTAISCGLVINELVTNSLKYAFPEDRPGEIAVSIRESGNHELELLVSDNGVGVPESFNLKADTGTLGLKLVTNLVENQLDGKIEIDRSQGTTYKIIFRQTKEED